MMDFTVSPNGDQKLIEAFNAEAHRRWPHLPQDTAKQRARARKRLMEAAHIEALEDNGASCWNCANLMGAPAYFSEKWACDFHSGGGAYAVISNPKIQLCARWRSRLEIDQ